MTAIKAMLDWCTCDDPLCPGVKGDTVMDAFKAMLAETVAKLDVLKHRSDMSYMLKCEVSYLRSVLDDVDRRMKKDLEGYEEAS